MPLHYLISCLLVLCVCPNLSLAQGYFYFNGQYYRTGSSQRDIQEFESRKDKYCSIEYFYNLLNLDPNTDLHYIEVDDDYDKFFESYSSRDKENEKKAKHNSKVLKSAWKKIALKMHPDKVVTKNTSDSTKKYAEEKFQEIQLAYETLKDAKTKHEYDKIWKNYCKNSEKYNRIRQEKYALWNAGTDQDSKYKSSPTNELIKKFLDFTNYKIGFDVKTDKTVDPLEKVHILCYRRMVEYVFRNLVPVSNLVAFGLHLFVNFMYGVWIYRTFGGVAEVLMVAGESCKRQ